jgi:hypothetical protein
MNLNRSIVIKLDNSAVSISEKAINQKYESEIDSLKHILLDINKKENEIIDKI